MKKYDQIVIVRYGLFKKQKTKNEKNTKCLKLKYKKIRHLKKSVFYYIEFELGIFYEINYTD